MVTDVIKTLFECDVQKETTLEIMYELVNNSSKYVDQEDNIDQLLKEKLTIDSYIQVKNYFKIKNND